MEKMKMESVDITNQKIEKIGKLFPNCITEAKYENGKLKKAINFELLKQMLSEDVAEGDEKYEFTWVGKKESIVEAHKPIRKTLRPCKEESVNWDKTENLYIEGDNLEVLKLLQESYLGKVKMIYIDPPYNTGNDFIYRDNRSRSQHEENVAMGMYDEDDNKLFRNTDTNGRFHSDWCTMIYSRLMLARNLLSDDGVIFISIDDNEVHNLRTICDEIFGGTNFICNFIRTTRKGGGSMSKYVSTDNDYCLMYAKNISSVSRFFVPYSENYLKRYSEIDEVGKYFWDTFARNRQGSSNNYTIIAPDGTELRGAWIYQENKFKELYDKGDVRIRKINSGWSVQCKQRLNEAGQIMRSQLNDFTNDKGTNEIVNLLGRDMFSYSKPVELIQYLIHAVTKKNDIVLDFFSGSATTAHAVMQLNAEDGGNRKFIMVQLPEPCDEKSEAFKAGYKNICEIGKERIRRAGKKIINENPDKADSLDIGFRTFKLDTTNMKDVYYSAGDYTQNLLDSLKSNIKPDRTGLDLLFGCLLEWGLPLSMPYKSEVIDGYTIHNYNNGDLIACFEKKIPNSLIKNMAKMHPLRAIFCDSNFMDSPSKINVIEIFKTLSTNTRIKII